MTDELFDLGPTGEPPPVNPLPAARGTSDQSGRAVAYTDGSCIGNPGPGGWAVHAELPDGRVLELGGGELQTTNNRMELRAAIEAARLLAPWPGATIVTDSQYVRQGITSWVAGWKRTGWRTTTGKPVENRDLWMELDALADDRLAWEWTRGHVGVPGNERCDAISRWFASSITSLGLLDGGGPTRPGERPARAAGAPVRAPARSGARGSSGTLYLSLVDGVLERHLTWSDCERRVKGVRGARYRKARTPADESEILRAWGLTPADLFGV